MNFGTTLNPGRLEAINSSLEMDFRKEITEKHCQPIHTKDPYAIQADRKDTGKISDATMDSERVGEKRGGKNLDTGK